MTSIFTTGTINQPDAGSVGLAMAERIRDDVTAHEAWDLVEEFTPASGTVRWYVLRCLAASSGLPADYYVVIGRTLGSGELRLFICEAYDPPSHTAKYATPQLYFNSYTYDETGRYPANIVLGTQRLGDFSPSPKYTNWIPLDTSSKWWIIVTEDGFTVAFSGAANGFFHVGAYIPLTQLPILLPIQWQGYQDSMGGITNNPGIPGLTTPGAALTIIGGGGPSASNSEPLGFMGSLQYNDKLQGGQRPVAEVAMTLAPYNQGDQAVYGYALGKQKRMRMTKGALPPGMTFGDAYVLENRLWVPYNPTDGRMWDTGVAAS